ncbi:MAG: sigma-70 family RNA polymerase sigma factor [Pirellulaceae bacterium]
MDATNDQHQAELVDLESINSLMRMAQGGSSRARSELFDQLQSYIVLMADSHFAEPSNRKVGPSDIVQQTCLLAVEKFGDFQGSTLGQFKAWLKVILQNQVRQNYRDLHRGKRDVRKERKFDGNPGVQPSDNFLTPHANAIHQEQLDELIATIDELSDDYQEVLRLRSLEGLPFKQVAERMNRSVDSVTKLWYRAFMRLQEKMETNDPSID